MASLRADEIGRKLYRVWAGMHERCSDPKHKSWAYYGGRGIRVEPEWDNFWPFKRWAINAGYRPGLKVDRINNDGNYSPDNCRLVTHKENMHNARFNVWVEAWGERKVVSEWARDERCKVSRKTVVRRVAAGYSGEDAVGLPEGTPLKQRSESWCRRLVSAFGETKSMASWSRDARCVVPYSALAFRLDEGWDAERAITAPSGDGKLRSSITAFGETKALSQWLKDPRCVVGESCLAMRLSKYKWTPERALSTPVKQKTLA